MSEEKITSACPGCGTIWRIMPPPPSCPRCKSEMVTYTDEEMRQIEAIYGESEEE